MAKLLPVIPASDGFNMYLRLRYLLAGIARCMFFFDKELTEVVQSAPCRAFAARCTEHYFHNSRSAAIYADMTLLFQCLITIAPILQQQLNSVGFDWHHGHVLTWFRVNSAVNVGRHFLSIEEHPRSHDSLTLRENLNILNINDSRFVDTLELLFRAYYGRNSVSGKLANTLFDPIMLSHLGDRETMRVGNRLFRMEKKKFSGCIDLREESAVVFAYRIKRIETQEKVASGGKRGGKSSAKPETVTHRMLEITIDERHISKFKQSVKTFTHGDFPLKYKISELNRLVGAFVYSVRYARNGFEQVLSLSRWLCYRLEPLCIEAEIKAKKNPDYLYDLVRRLPDIMLNKFLMNGDHRRYYRRPNFFYDPREHDELTLVRFMSPFREGGE